MNISTSKINYNPIMNLAILGATGGTGLQITEQALAAGHSVTVLTRDSNPTNSVTYKASSRSLQAMY